MIEGQDGEHAGKDEPAPVPSVKWTDTQRVGRWAVVGFALAVVAILLLFVLSALR